MKSWIAERNITGKNLKYLAKNLKMSGELQKGFISRITMLTNTNIYNIQHIKNNIQGCL